MQQIAREVYYNQLGPQFYTNGVNINVGQVAQLAASLPILINRSLLFNKKLAEAININNFPAFSQDWKMNELKLREHMKAENVKWERRVSDEGLPYFVRLDKGVENPGNPVDSCVFFANNNEAGCSQFLQDCLMGQDFTGCMPLIDDPNYIVLNFPNVNDAPHNIIKSVTKINPTWALLLLKKFNYGFYLAEDQVPGIQSLRRYKVQSVNEWLKDLEDPAILATIGPCDCNEGAKLLQKLNQTLIC